MFLINLPIGGVAAWAAIRHVPETHELTATGRLDYPGAALLALSLVGITFTPIEAPGGGSTTDVALVAALGVTWMAAPALKGLAEEAAPGLSAVLSARDGRTHGPRWRRRRRPRGRH